MTRYLSAWAHVFIREISEKGREVYVLKEKDTNRKKFEGMVAKNKPSVLFLNGHGNTNVVTGHDHEVILDSKSVGLIKDLTVYAVSCQSAQGLGRLAVSNGVKGYVGYLEDFILISQSSKMRHPTEDTTAALFMEPSNQVIRSLAKGHTPAEAVKKGKAAFSESIRKALNSDVQSDDDKYVSFLLWDRQWLTSC